MKSIDLTPKLIPFLLCISTSYYKLMPAVKIVSLLWSCLSHGHVLTGIRKCSLHVPALFLTYFKLNYIYIIEFKIYIYIPAFLLNDNCFTEFCCFLSNLNKNQPSVYICPLPFEPPSHLPPHLTSLD